MRNKAKTYYHNNKDKRNAYAKKYQKNNRLMYRAIKRKRICNIKNTNDFSVNKNTLLFLYINQQFKCAIC